MITILSRKSVTASKLCKEGGFFRARKYSDIPLETTLLINWGYIRKDVPRNSLNKTEAITFTSRKNTCREFLRSNGISVPEYSETPPCIGRKSYHSQGKDFFVCFNDWMVEQAKEHGCSYFSKIYEKDREIRVHVAGGRAILVSDKIGGKGLVWNHEAGFNLRHMKRSEWLDDKALMEAVRSAKKAISLSGLDFGAIDIFFSGGNHYVCEINTTPGLSTLARSKYIDYFKGIK